MVALLRSRFARLWVQVFTVVAVLLGIVGADIAVAQSQIADNHHKAALRKLHRAEIAYAKQVDAISLSLYFTVQPVQNALDNADSSKPTYIDGARDAVVNSRISPTVTKVSTKVAAL